jgi:hypothetical protein
VSNVCRWRLLPSASGRGPSIWNGAFFGLFALKTAQIEAIVTALGNLSGLQDKRERVMQEAPLLRSSDCPLSPWERVGVRVGML